MCRYSHLGMRTASLPRSKLRPARTGGSGKTNSPGTPRFRATVAPRHQLTYSERTSKQKANGAYVALEIYRADPADCKECPLKARCVHGNSGAWTVRRQLHEDLIDKMRD